MAFVIIKHLSPGHESALRTLRKTCEELIGHVVWDVFPDLDGTVFGEKYLEAMDRQAPIEFEDYYEPFDVWTYAKLFPSPRGLTVYYQDVTGRRRAEEALREANEEFAAARSIMGGGKSVLPRPN